MRPLIGIGVALALWFGAPASASPLPPTMDATVPVHIVFVGFDEKAYVGHETEPFDPRAIYSDVLPNYLPATDDPLVLVDGVPADHHLGFTYDVDFAPDALADQLFTYMGRTGKRVPRTFWAGLYNDQQHNALEVPEQMLSVPGPAVERWLLAHLPGIGRRDNTIVFVNWYGRPGFRFHVIHGEGKDPDTGQDQAAPDHAGSAYGASAGRLWFYDMSAGPEPWNWAADFGWDQQVAPIWEMSETAPGLMSNATDVAGYLARYSLYGQQAASPLFDPLTYAPARSGRRVLRENRFDEDAARPQSAYRTPAYVERGLKDLQPYFDVRSTQATHPFAGEDRTVYETWAGAFSGQPGAPGCWQSLGTQFLAIACHVRAHEDRFRPPAGPDDAVIPAMVYSTTDATRAAYPGVPNGIANLVPGGTKPYVAVVRTAPADRAFDSWNFLAPGLGASHVLLHETGHLTGLPHEHDVWDSELGSYLPGSSVRWLHVLDECQCPMGYTYNGVPFGTFEHDTVDRSLAARYYAAAYRGLGALPRNRAASVGTRLEGALSAFRRLDFRAAVLHARAAYEQVPAAPTVTRAARVAAPVVPEEPRDSGPLAPPDGSGTLPSLPGSPLARTAER